VTEVETPANEERDC